MLTGWTGLLDAVSYLKFGHVFAANMTGNVVFLGFALAGAGGVSLSSSFVALMAFLAGALIGGRLGIHYRDHRGRLLAAAVHTETVLVAAAFFLALGRASDLDGTSQSAIVLLLAIAMGIQNAAVRRVAVPDLTTTVLTLTLTGLAADSRWAGGTAPRWHRRLGSVVAMLAGAFAGGALVLHADVAVPLGVVTAALLATGLLIWRMSPASASWRSLP
jgi:uncharacterized membrane protein YoaK (UPF0700 family)